MHRTPQEFPETSYQSNGFLAQQVARRIQDLILTKALQSGDFLGRECDIGVQLGISRPTLRTAIRFLELAGRVRTRPGVNGGVFVTEPDAATTTAVLARHIVALGQSLPVFLSIHMPFFACAADLAAANALPSQREALASLTTTMLEAEDSLAAFRPIRLRLRLQLLQATGLSAMEFIGEALMHAYMQILDGELNLGDTEAGKVRIVKNAEASILAPLIAGDQIATLAAFDRAAEQERSVTSQTIRDGMGPESAVPHTLFGKLAQTSGSTRLAEHLTRAIRRDIHFSYPAGSLIGSIAEIAVRYGVSQEICREALGLLSLHGLVTVRRGNGGGVFSGEPRLDGIGKAVDSALLKCSGLSELVALLTDIGEALRQSEHEPREIATTLTFLGQLSDRVVGVMSARG